MSEEHTDDNGASSVASEYERKFLKLSLPEHIAAYLEKRELCRDVQELVCDKNLLEKITNNYVIAKQIISNLTWQEKLLCKHVCSMWRTAVLTLQREQLWPTDFSISLRPTNIKNGIKFLKSSDFYTEPLAVFTFTNISGFMTSSRCESLVPSPCDPSCEQEHYLIDMIQTEVAATKKCMVTVQASFPLYMPLPQSISYENAIRYKMFIERYAFIGGVCIPVIPNVHFTTINLKSVHSAKEKFYSIVDKLVQNDYIKGALVFVNASYLLETIEDIVFLNYLKNVQTNVPYALGGCIVEDTVSDLSDINNIIEGLNVNKEYVSENLISIGLFSIPKNLQEGQGANFDMFSLILESSDWSKIKIQSAIDEFAKRVPHFEHSVALKLSCMGRDQKHEIEQQYFRVAFPTTRIVGCYGNGELGINHPPRPGHEDSCKNVKRHRRDPGPHFGFMYSYSTVFVYIGWGRILTPAES